MNAARSFVTSLAPSPRRRVIVARNSIPSPCATFVSNRCFLAASRFSILFRYHTIRRAAGAFTNSVTAVPSKPRPARPTTTSGVTSTICPVSSYALCCSSNTRCAASFSACVAARACSARTLSSTKARCLPRPGPALTGRSGRGIASGATGTCDAVSPFTVTGRPRSDQRARRAPRLPGTRLALAAIPAPALAPFTAALKINAKSAGLSRINS